ncbi:MAG TPA: carboxypeptidase regulatory-like domain-containing protein [Gemmatimonadaceae bacterium]|jgi:hypothetical protein
MRQVLLGLLLAGSAHAQTGVLSGRILDSLRNPLGNATVSLPSLNSSTISDTGGNFRLSVPSGSHRVTIRHIGFAVIDTTLNFTADQTMLLEVTLKQIGYGVAVLLDTVVSNNRGPIDLGMADFEANRLRGFGKFLTRADLEKVGGRAIGSRVSELQGVNVLHGHAGQAWVTSKRAPRSRCASINPPGRMVDQATMDRCLALEQLIYVPDHSEEVQGVQRACYSLVFLDANAVNATHPTMPFDLNSIDAGSLEAIEWYESSSQLPGKYAGRNPQCGLLVLHTIRFRKKG